jgi:1-deoxy-D-xylulose-5-phosphate synthase
MKGPRLVHVVTTKGKGFAPAEADQVKWHAQGGFDPAPARRAEAAAGGLPRYQQVFGEALTELAREYPRVVAITAAMAGGTGCDLFEKAHPERFFDVGIAEGHGVTFAAGLATQGMKPVVAIYSTFLQRAYDSIVHDVALQDLPVTFVMDRAGIAGDDGQTHHGGIDIGYMLAVPEMTVTAPKDGEELVGLLRLGIEWNGPFSSASPATPVPPRCRPRRRRSRGAVRHLGDAARRHRPGDPRHGNHGAPGACGRGAAPPRRVSATVVNCRFVKPLDEAVLERLFPAHGHVLTVEEGTEVNGFGAYVRTRIADRWPGVSGVSMGLPDRFVEHGERHELLAELGLNAEGIATRARALLGRPLRELLESA